MIFTPICREKGKIETQREAYCYLMRKKQKRIIWCICEIVEFVDDRN